MTDKDQNPRSVPVGNETSEGKASPVNKRPFIEPEMSQPVDVLEATTFFQAVDSGATN